MSWLFSRVLVEAYSEANSWGGARCVLSNWIVTPPAFLSKDKTKGSWSHSQFGTTLPHLTDALGLDLLMWFRGAFHARTSAAQDVEKESMESEADYGVNSLVSLAKFNRDTHSLKTRQILLFEDSTESLLILPRWGWMRDGECFLLAPLVHHMCDADCSLWPTPRTDGRDNCGGSNARRKAQANGTHIGRYRIRYYKKG